MIGKFDDSMFVGTAVGLEIFGNNIRRVVADALQYSEKGLPLVGSLCENGQGVLV